MVVQHFSSLGTPGLNQQSGIIGEDSVQTLRGKRGIAIYREMGDGDAIIGATLFAIEMLCRRVTWRSVPFDTEQDSIDRADFVWECLSDMSTGWEDTLSEILTFLQYGFAPMETVLKRREGWKEDGSRSKYDDGRIGWRKWSLRSQDTIDRWNFDEQGGIAGLKQSAPPTFKPVDIPIEKMLLFRTTTRKNNPEGRSILRTAYGSWYYKKNIQRIEAIGIERDLTGIPIAWVPPEILAQDAGANEQAMRNEIANIVTRVKRDEQEGLIFPLAYNEAGQKLYDLTLLSTGGTRQVNTDPVIARYDQRIAMTMLADFILLGHENVGSFALSSSKTNLFAYALGSFLDMIADVINTHAIPRLFQANGWPVDRLPRLEHGDIESVDLAELGAYIGALAGTGAVFDDKAVAYLFEQAGIPHNIDQQDSGEI